MAITQEFRDAISRGDVRTVRIIIKDSLVSDPTFSEYNQMIDLSSSMSGLYDIHDGEVLNCDISAWTSEYENEQMRKVIRNFSKERLELLKSMSKHFRQAATAKNERARHDAQHEYSANRTVSRKQIGTGVAVAGVAVAVVGAASQAATIGVGIVAAVIGGIIIITDK